MGEERQSAVQGHTKKSGGCIKDERVAEKREGGSEGGFAGVGAEEAHLALSRVKRKLPVKRPSLESL